MKKLILFFLLVSSFKSFSQTISSAGCSTAEYKYTDTVNNYSICIPKGYVLKRLNGGISFSEASNPDHEIIIQSSSNPNNTLLTDWTNSMEKVLSKGAAVPVFTQSNFSPLTTTGIRKKGLQLKATYSDGGESNVIYVPVSNDNSKVLVILFVQYPKSDSIADVIFSGKAQSMIYSFKLINKEATTESADFFKQLNLLIGKGDKEHLSTLKSKLVKTEPNGAKIYSCSVELQGFQTSIRETTAQTSLDAMAMSTPYLNTQIALLLDNTGRNKNGLVNYTATDYKAANKATCATFDSVTELSKEGSALKIRVFKFPGGMGYILTLL